MNRDDIIHDEVGECLSNTFWHCTNVAQIRGLYKNIINVRIKYKVYKYTLLRNFKSYGCLIVMPYYDSIFKDRCYINICFTIC